MCTVLLALGVNPTVVDKYININFFMHSVLIFPVFEHCHTFKECITDIYTVILSCILLMRHEQVLGFLSIYF